MYTTGRCKAGKSDSEGRDNGGEGMEGKECGNIIMIILLRIPE